MREESGGEATHSMLAIGLPGPVSRKRRTYEVSGRKENGCNQ
jgi:hypothetical protein